MQSTGIHNEYNHWTIHVDPDIQFKNKGMGWNYCGDLLNLKTQQYKNLEDAIQFCDEVGYNYRVDQPRFRRFTYKNYADNFQWKGEPDTSNQWI